MPDDAPATLLARAREAAPRALGGALTGLQGVVLSYLVVLVPALAGVAGAPNLDGSATVDWGGAADVATQVWLLGHGVPVAVAGGSIALVPLGLPLVSAAILLAVARRFAAKTWASWAFACGAYAVGAAAIAAGADADALLALRAGLAGALIAAPSVALGIWRTHGARLRLLDRLPLDVRTGLRLGGATAGAILGLAALAGAAWAYLGREDVASLASGLGMDPLGAGALALAELLYVPTLVAWMAAWVVGPGFAVGEGTLVSPAVVEIGDLPHVPLLGALPSAGGGWLVWVPAVAAVAALVVRVLLHRRIVPLQGHGLDLSAARVAGTGLGVVALALAGVTVASSGAMGPGRLATVGGDALLVTAAGVGLAAAGWAIVWLTVAAWRGLRGRAAGAADDARDDARAEARDAPAGAAARDGVTGAQGDATAAREPAGASSTATPS